MVVTDEVVSSGWEARWGKEPGDWFIAIGDLSYMLRILPGHLAMREINADIVLLRKLQPTELAKAMDLVKAELSEGEIDAPAADADGLLM